MVVQETTSRGEKNDSGTLVKALRWARGRLPHPFWLLVYLAFAAALVYLTLAIANDSVPEQMETLLQDPMLQKMMELMG